MGWFLRNEATAWKKGQSHTQIGAEAPRKVVDWTIDMGQHHAA